MVAMSRTAALNEDHGFRDNAVFLQEFFWAFTAFNDPGVAQEAPDGPVGAI
jgi:hypothetical protein